ncbi:hypothetical protein DIX60_08860 [Streptococcus iniae]|uniref:Uncharacterized protein n=1 Tax=Streptococcus iniae TaxID=1346 RepID=A0A1J0N104_STRIN|nr:hypothetical protein DQ08_08760 [Streptococcus iniae]ESR09555.1 hypothetical protein IUSA1_06300 [Streptococcus iniae IUSA1]AHY18391.1 hypothetical protein DW64_08745 [Streptococcus iniae]APD32550.1 hypothetical protein BMF34_08755 [Streptococcus iniae]ASL35520.1 hypothetical protein QMA0248_1749 [Streptococcus iniae]
MRKKDNTSAGKEFVIISIIAIIILSALVYLIQYISHLDFQMTNETTFQIFLLILVVRYYLPFFLFTIVLSLIILFLIHITKKR